MGTSPTKPSMPRLSDVARHVVIPDGVVATGFPAVEAKCRDLGIGFRPWQDGAGRIILSKRADGKYAATIGGTGLSFARQVGKTFLVGAIVFALCLLRPGLTVVWTAHRLRTAEETFKKMRGLAARKRVAPHVARVVLGSGEGAVEFRNGSRILFGARERGFGRGFDEVDVLVCDESQILTDNAQDDMVPATNQSRQPTGALLIYLGTPPKPTDPGEVFTRMRAEALSGEDHETGWIEFGADPGYEPTALPAPLTDADWEQVAKANPSFPIDTPPEAILRMRKKLGPDSFIREGMGRWDRANEAKLIMPAWPLLAEVTEPPPPVALGLAMDLDRVWLSLAASSGGDVPHLGSVLRVRVDTGRASLLAEAARIVHDRRLQLVVDPKDAAGNLEDDLAALGVLSRKRNLIHASFDDYVQACANLYDAVEAKEASHGDYDDLNEAVAAARWSTGKRRVWAPLTGDVSMLKAASLAMWGATAAPLPPRRAMSF